MSLGRVFDNAHLCQDLLVVPGQVVQSDLLLLADTATTQLLLKIKQMREKEI